MRGLVVPFVGFTVLYCVLGVIVAYLLYRQVVRTMPYVPPAWARADSADAARGAPPESHDRVARPPGSNPSDARRVDPARRPPDRPRG